MTRHRSHIVVDFVYIFVSIVLAFVLAQLGAFHLIALSLYRVEFLGIVLVGALFTSVFTTAPAIGILGELAQHTNVFLVALLGGVGAMIGDYLIFRFVRDRIGEDVEYLIRHSRWRRFPAFFRTRLFHRFAPMVGALVIISPLPDELGLALLGLSQLSTKRFFIISFLLNAVGILIIGSIARVVAGQPLFF